MNWHVVFNSRTGSSDYHNIAPLPKMSEEAAKCFQEQRRRAQNGEIDGTVHVAVTTTDVILFRILLTGKQDPYGRDIRCAEGLYGTSADIRRDWATILSLAAGLWSMEESWYATLVQEDTVMLFTPEEAVASLLAVPVKALPGELGIADLRDADSIQSFRITQDGISTAKPPQRGERELWKPAKEKQKYRIVCHISKAEKQAWLETVDCGQDMRILVESARVARSSYGYSVKKLQQAAEAMRKYLDAYGWREAT